MAAIEDAIRTIVASGKAAGTLMTKEQDAGRALEPGCTFVATGVDVVLFAAAAALALLQAGCAAPRAGTAIREINLVAAPAQVHVRGAAQSAVNAWAYGGRRPAVSRSSFGPVQPPAVAKTASRCSISVQAASAAAGDRRARIRWIGLAESRTNCR